MNTLNSNFYITQDGGYTFKHLPDWILSQWSNQLRDLFELSVQYTTYYFCKISNNHFDYLREALHITEVDSTVYNFYIDHSEGYLWAYQTKAGWSIIIQDESPDSTINPNSLLLKILNTNTLPFVRNGLWSMLDPNVGGLDSQTACLNIANEIIYG